MCVAAVLMFGSAAQADLIAIDTVAVGDVGNTADTTGYGAVDYTYNIGKYEVTAGQYTAFLNAVAKTDTYGLYNSSMWSSTYGCKIQQSGSAGNYSYSVAADYANRPVNYVSHWDSCRFANWLHNGQGNGDTETGAYTLNGYTGTDGRTIQRNAGATWAVPSVNEAYKAAYYKGGGTSAGYWLYATQSDTQPGFDLDDGSGNNANFKGDLPIQSPYYTTVVGDFQNSESAYGTFDQSGNVSEWNEAVNGAAPCLLGGAFTYTPTPMPRHPANPPLTSESYGVTPDNPWSPGADDLVIVEPGHNPSEFGFRVCQVPEPGALVMLGVGLAGLLGYRLLARRRRKA
jgi:hypothetical protein